MPHSLVRLQYALKWQFPVTPCKMTPDLLQLLCISTHSLNQLTLGPLHMGRLTQFVEYVRLQYNTCMKITAEVTKSLYSFM